MTGQGPVPRYFLALVCTVLAASLLSSCGGTVRAPVGERLPKATMNTGFHVVRRGESLFSIAFQYDLDYETLARWNGIGPPYTIYVGQRLRLAPPARAAAPVATRKPTPSPPRSESVPRSPPPAAAPQPSTRKPATKAPPATASASVARWRWPVEGRIIKRFDAKSPGKKGIAIAGRPGTPVRAAAAGRVVYAGSGLVGYGRLIIIKHNKIYLSAYGHNREILVREGDQVKAGQVIARMGSSGTRQTMLHFEIRRYGKPVDPLRYLPRR